MGWFEVFLKKLAGWGLFSNLVGLKTPHRIRVYEIHGNTATPSVKLNS